MSTYVDRKSPILLDQEFGPWRMLGTRPKPRADVAVLVASGNESLIRLQRPLTAGEWAFRGTRRLVEIDLAERRQKVEFDLPSSTDVPAFHATVELWWRVSDPVSVAVNQVTNVGDRFLSRAMTTMRRVSRQFSFQDSALAEEALGDTIDESWLDLDGVRVRRTSIQVTRAEFVQNHQFAALGEHQLNEITGIRRARLTDFEGSGSVGMLSYHLTQNPDDALRVARELAEHEQVELSVAMEIVLNGHRTGNLQQMEIDKVREDAMQRIFRRVAGERADLVDEPDAPRKIGAVTKNEVIELAEPVKEADEAVGKDEQKVEDS